MSSEVTFKLQLLGSDGKTYIVHLDNPGHLNWLHQRLGICSLEARINELERQVEQLEQPIRMQRVMELLKDQPQGRTSGWISRRIPKFRYDDLSMLKAEGKIVSFRIGNCWKYKLAEEPR